jgi:hypothetical protein
MGKIINIITILIIMNINLFSNVLNKPICVDDIVLVETTTGVCPINYLKYEFKNYELSDVNEEWFEISLKNMCYGLKEQTTDCIKENKQFDNELYLQLLEKLENNEKYKNTSNCIEIKKLAGDNGETIINGYYQIKNNIEVYCDMETDGGGWLDVIKTLKKHPEYLSLFFLERSIVGLPVTMENAIGTEGFYLKYRGNYAPIYFDSQKVFKNQEVNMKYILQGGDNGYRCNSSDWVPLNGPGYDGNHSSFATCTPGRNCIQGKSKNYNDRPIEAVYVNSNLTAEDLLTWSGFSYNSGTTTGNCSKSYKIPTNHVALWFEILKIR